MKRAMQWILMVAVALPAAGCVLVPQPYGRPQTVQCHPSQYWDGSQCRHKGQGQGARKHDGDGKPGKGKGNKHDH